MDQNFRDQNINEADLHSLLAKISKARTELRFTHLRTHLMTTNILSREQIAHYNTLRGYSSDPCSSIPKGHDPAMWKRHNGCK
ncbi:MAG: hypothetical protein JKY99_03245 [Rhizobiales bacterium]|nr:hypothetical protein [Hyphomicrobiales bacterium]